MINLNELLGSEESKLSFMRGLIYLAKADGEIDESEKVFFTQAAATLNMNENSMAQVNERIESADNELVLNFDDKKQSLFLIREAIQLCYVDGKYDDNEKSAIAEMSRQLNVSTSKVNEIENWVIEGINWSRRGESIIELED